MLVASFKNSIFELLQLHRAVMSACIQQNKIVKCQFCLNILKHPGVNKSYFRLY